jgi:hypothetical protein
VLSAAVGAVVARSVTGAVMADERRGE